MRKLLLLIFFTLHLFGQTRIIPLSPLINEVIFALKAQEQIVGNTDYCTYPKESLSIPKIGGYFNPNLEKIIALKPDVVVMQTNNTKLRNQLKEFSIKTLVFSIDSFSSILDGFLKIGALVGKTQEAHILKKRAIEALNKTKNIVKDKKILVVFSPTTNFNKPIFVSGHHLYFHDIIEHSGNKNAFYSTQKGQPTLSYEKLISLNPDIVIILAPYIHKSDVTLKELKTQWQKLPITASKKKNIYVVDKEYAGIASDRIILFLRDFKGFLEDVRSK